MGESAGLERFRQGLAVGEVYVPREYFQYCQQAFAELGGDHLQRYRASTQAPLCPLRKLTIIRAPANQGF